MRMDDKYGGETVRPFRINVLNTFATLTAIAIILFMVWLLSRIFFIEQFSVSTASMEPTITPGDKLIVDKTLLGARIYTNLCFNKRGNELKCKRTRGTRALRHNDIIVFNNPFHRGEIKFVLNDVYVKRCIGLPGDSISIENGIYRNNNAENVGLKSTQCRLFAMRDSEIASDVIMKKHSTPHYIWTIKNMPPLYVPRKGDIISITPKEGYLYKSILEWETGKVIVVDWEKNIVCCGNSVLNKHRFLHNYVFVAGDNVMNSRDSRYWGVIPYDYIIGIVRYIFH